MQVFLEIRAVCVGNNMFDNIVGYTSEMYIYISTTPSENRADVRTDIWGFRESESGYYVVKSEVYGGFRPMFIFVHAVSFIIVEYIYLCRQRHRKIEPMCGPVVLGVRESK